ncbi:hypothetical protein [Hyphomonas sp. GM-8P]|uniref:hypothetical protein n=1 Tax=Hyphomonas sp. GM-8P TaxID=1280945 RepID=UPI00131470A2|nr:hypothetical protein [Hyphomonas sp. GM-8P]
MLKFLCLVLSTFWFNFAARGETLSSKIPLDGFQCSASVVGVCSESKCGEDRMHQQLTVNQNLGIVEMCVLHPDNLKCVDLHIDDVSATKYAKRYELSQNSNSTITLIVNEAGQFHLIRTDAVGALLNTFTTAGLCSLKQQ